MMIVAGVNPGVEQARIKPEFGVENEG